MCAGESKNCGLIRITRATSSGFTRLTQLTQLTLGTPGSGRLSDQKKTGRAAKMPLEKRGERKKLLEAVGKSHRQWAPTTGERRERQRFRCARNTFRPTAPRLERVAYLSQRGERAIYGCGANKEELESQHRARSAIAQFVAKKVLISGVSETEGIADSLMGVTVRKESIRGGSEGPLQN